MLSQACQSKQEPSFHNLRPSLQVGRLQPERDIPAAVLRGAAGFAILSVLKVRLLWVLFDIGRVQLPAAERQNLQASNEGMLPRGRLQPHSMCQPLLPL